MSNSFSIGAEQALVNGEIVPASIVVKDGVIASVDIAPSHFSCDIMITDGVLSPGFIDCQINGVGEINFFDADKNELALALTTLARHGVTSCTPSMISAPIGELVSAIRQSDCGEIGLGRARHLGYHIEGPFLADQFARAHNSRYFSDPTTELLEPLLDTGRIAIITLAPERHGAPSVIERAAAAGVIVSAGHSGATFDQMRIAHQAGLSMITHLFNGMSKKLDEGIVRAAQEISDVTVGLIADGIHNDKEKVRWAFNVMADRIALVTDALATRIGDQEIHVRDGGGYRKDGTLAGSTLTLDQVVARAVAMGVPLAQALTSATAIPARLLGRHNLGEIKVGALADLTCFTEGGSIRTWIGGVEVSQ